MTSCAPPFPATKRIEAPNGLLLEKDFSYIQPGITTREQVAEHFKSIDTGVAPGMFWGRFNKSGWFDPSGSRHWGRGNLLVTYDANGVATTVRTVGDERVNRILMDWLAAGNPQTDFKSPMKIAATSVHGYTRLGPVTVTTPDQNVEAQLILQQEQFVFVEPKGKVAVRVSPARIRRLHTSSLDLSVSASNNVIQEKIWIEATDGAIRSFEVQVSPADLLVLLEYLRQHCPRAKYD